MARIRTLKPEAWADRKVGLLSLEARLLWVVLITMSDDYGAFEADVVAILGHGYRFQPQHLAEIDTWLSELEEAGLIVRYEAGDEQYGLFPKWEEHQQVKNPGKKFLPRPNGEQPELHRRVYGESAESVGKVSTDSTEKTQKVPDSGGYSDSTPTLRTVSPLDLGPRTKDLGPRKEEVGEGVVVAGEASTPNERFRAAMAREGKAFADWYERLDAATRAGIDEWLAEQAPKWGTDKVLEHAQRKAGALQKAARQSAAAKRAQGKPYDPAHAARVMAEFEAREAADLAAERGFRGRGAA